MNAIMMGKIIVILKEIHGVFSSVVEHRECSLLADFNQPVTYLGIEQDKYNLRHDMLNIYSDFMKSVEEANRKYSVHDE
jgi:hypothetical protein